MSNDTILYYIHDPMCSWCWGFKPVLESLTLSLPASVKIEYLLGGLAADTDKQMPVEMQNSIKDNWKRIQQTIPGISFNYDFWTKCTPKRSTYPSCRAVIAAKNQHPDKDIEMIAAIQRAYYLHAKNTSDYSVLYDLADEINLDMNKFKLDIQSESTNNILIQQISLSRKIGADSFPSLYLKKDKDYYPVALDYNNIDIILEHIHSII